MNPSTIRRIPGRGPRRRRRPAIGALLAAAILWTPLAASAQSSDLRALTDMVRRLELQVSALERSLLARDRRGPNSVLEIDPTAPTTNAQFVLRLSDIEEVLRQMTGRLEQLENNFNRQADNLERLAADVDFRLRTLEAGGQRAAQPDGAAPIPGPIGPVGQPATGRPDEAASAPPSLLLPPGPPELQYNFAYDFLLRGRYAEAQAAFEAFIAAHPDDPRSGNSQHWLGQTYYARDQFDDAARAFARGFERYPDSDRVTDNLLWLGLSLTQLGRTENACDTFNLLLEDYPQAPSNVRQRAVQQHGTLAC